MSQSHKNQSNPSAKKTSIGGQALIEGVMMRGPFVTAMAVRHTSGNIVLEQWETQGKNRPKWMKVPLIRGVVGMIDSMIFGYKCLMRSAELSGLDAEEDAEKEARRAKKAAKKAAHAGAPIASSVSAEATISTADAASATDAPPVADAPLAAEGALADDAVDEVIASTVAQPAAPSKPEPKPVEKFFFSLAMVFSTVLGVAIAVVLFMWLPTFLYNNVLKTLIPALADGFRWVQSVVEGVMRLALFLGYVMLISCMKDIRRVFMYHGAEHKSIFCYEHGLPLTVENVRKQSRFHPRCGTSFLVLSLIVGVLVSMCIPIYDNTLLRVVVKLLMLPLVVGIGYELIKLAGRRDDAFTRIISKPGMWVQHITTKEPDDGMMECAIKALEAVIPDDPEADKW